MSVSALILTFNEEVNLPDCLDSLKWCEDVVVLDSYSTDKTEHIARDQGARFAIRKFDDYASQRNFGINEIKYKNEWLLMVDADETLTEELKTEIINTVEQVQPSFSMFRMRRKDYFMGRWIRHSSGYPTWFGRLMKIGAVHVNRRINEEYITSGKIGYLDGHLIHHPFNKGFHAWLDKHNRYSSMEAEAIFSDGFVLPRIRDFIDSDPAARRKALKSVVYKMPMRPAVIFFGLYFMKLGLMDGIPGLTFCLLRCFYEYMIDCKIRELRLRQTGLTI